MEKAYEVVVRILSLLGPLAAVFLVAIISAAVLILVYMLLHFGEEGMRMFLPFVSQVWGVLRSEPRKTHPAIKLEFRFHLLLAAVFILCFLAIVLHAIVPWISHHVELALITVWVCDFVALIILGGVSFYAALRLS